MKRIKEYIPYAAVYFLCVLLSRYDTDGRLWFLNLALLLAGVYALYRWLKPELDQEAKSLSGGGDLIGFFLSAAVPVALIGFLFFAGYTGSFHSSIGTQGDTLFAALGNGLIMLILPVMFCTFVSFVIMVPLGAVLSSLLHYDGKIGISLMLAGWCFLGLCYLCGVVDMFALLKAATNLREMLPL